MAKNNDKIIIIKVEKDRPLTDVEVVGCYATWEKARKYLPKLANKYSTTMGKIVGNDAIGFDDGTLFRIERESWNI